MFFFSHAMERQKKLLQNKRKKREKKEENSRRPKNESRKKLLRVRYSIFFFPHFSHKMAMFFCKIFVLATKHF